LSGLKRWLFRTFIRHWMNRNVASIREATDAKVAIA